MRKLVLDSSVLIKWLNSSNENYLENADKILSECLDGQIEIIAPELAKYEVGNVLLHSKTLSEKKAQIPLQSFFAFPIRFVNLYESLAKETYKTAYKWGITYYDASFIALAKEENATLVTDNTKHQGKTKRVKVISLNEY